MSRLPRDIGSKQLIAAFKRLGFKKAAVCEGSHHGYYKLRADGTTITVTLLEGKSKGTIYIGTLAAILKRAEVSVDEFLEALK